jgi:hypothetical protein
MRLTKKQSHNHGAIKFVRKFAIIRKVQGQWLFWEHFYRGYTWDWICSDTNKDYYRNLERNQKDMTYSMVVSRRAEIPMTQETHSWQVFPQMADKLPEDEEVQKYLQENSPLMKALTE